MDLVIIGKGEDSSRSWPRSSPIRARLARWRSLKWSSPRRWPRATSRSSARRSSRATLPRCCVREPVGSPVRVGHPPRRRSADRQRPHPGPSSSLPPSRRTKLLVEPRSLKSTQTISRRTCWSSRRAYRQGSRSRRRGFARSFTVAKAAVVGAAVSPVVRPSPRRPSSARSSPRGAAASSASVFASRGLTPEDVQLGQQASRVVDRFEQILVVLDHLACACRRAAIAGT